jgi:hypothetical protein
MFNATFKPFITKPLKISLLLYFWNFFEGQIFEFVESNELYSDHFHSWLHSPQGINADPTVWLDHLQVLFQK